MGTPNFYPEKKKTKFFSGLKGGVPRVASITTCIVKVMIAVMIDISFQL